MANDHILSECPYCHGTPTVFEMDEDAHTRKLTLYGNFRHKFGVTFYCCIRHFCSKIHGSFDERTLRVEGRATIWGDFNGDIIYDFKEYEWKREHAKEIAIKKWNKMIKKIKKGIGHGKQ